MAPACDAQVLSVCYGFPISQESQGIAKPFLCISLWPNCPALVMRPTMRWAKGALCQGEATLTKRTTHNHAHGWRNSFNSYIWILFKFSPSPFANSNQQSKIQRHSIYNDKQKQPIQIEAFCWMKKTNKNKLWNVPNVAHPIHIYIPQLMCGKYIVLLSKSRYFIGNYILYY